MIVFHVRIRMNLMSGTVGYATVSNSTTYEWYYKLLSIKSGCYNEHLLQQTWRNTIGRRSTHVHMRCLYFHWG